MVIITQAWNGGDARDQVEGILLHAGIEFDSLESPIQRARPGERAWLAEFNREAVAEVILEQPLGVESTLG